MRSRSLLVAALLLFQSVLALWAQQNSPLVLVQTIPLPGVKGRLDHLGIDERGKRLFVAGLENGSVEVLDLKKNVWTRSIPGFKKPQGIQFVPALKKLFVASGDDGMLRVFRADTLELAESIPLTLGANRIAYDSATKTLYVGHGGKDAGKDYGEVAVVDAATNKITGTIRVVAHPAELLLDAAGTTLFVFISPSDAIQKADTSNRAVQSNFSTSSKRPGSGAYDETFQRLFVGTHAPPEMIVLDARSGKEITKLPTTEGMDGVWWDGRLKRIYVSGGRGTDVGSVFVYQQKDADHYEQIGAVPTRPGAGTSLWSVSRNRLYVAAPATADQVAAILVFQTANKRGNNKH